MASSLRPLDTPHHPRANERSGKVDRMARCALHVEKKESLTKNKRKHAQLTGHVLAVEFEFDLVRFGFFGRERDGVGVETVGLRRSRHLAAVDRHLQVARTCLACLHCVHFNKHTSHQFGVPV